MLSVALAASGGANATVIDDFNLGGADLNVTRPTSSGADVGSSSYSGILGGYRDLALYSVTGPDGRSAQLDTTGATLSLSNDTSVSSTARVAWDGSGGTGLVVDTDGLGSIDLTTGGVSGISLQVLSVDLNATLTFTVWSNSGADSSTAAHTFTGPVSEYFFPFSAFSGSASFSDVSAMMLEITGPTSVDSEFDLIQTSPPPPSVADRNITVLLLGVGLTAVGAARRFVR